MSKQRYSLARMKAAWANGSKSNGPSTPEGKKKIAMNAYTHGLTAKAVLAPGEDPESLALLVDSFIAIFQPADDAEFLLVEEMVAAKWKLHRSWCIEGSLFEAEICTQSEKVDAKFEGVTPELRYALAFRTLTDESKSLAHVNRQEVRLTRAHDRALEQLLLLQSLRMEREAVEAQAHEPGVENQHTSVGPQASAIANDNETNGNSGENSILQNEPKAVESSPQPGASPASLAPETRQEDTPGKQPDPNA
ncbi:MAG: hypothetical protein R2762_24180 [Bryobacteraceae bacterium]